MLLCYTNRSKGHNSVHQSDTEITCTYKRKVCQKLMTINNNSWNSFSISSGFNPSYPSTTLYNPVSNSIDNELHNPFHDVPQCWYNIAWHSLLWQKKYQNVFVTAASSFAHGSQENFNTLHRCNQWWANNTGDTCGYTQMELKSRPTFSTQHTRSCCTTSIEANSFKVQALAPSFVSYFINYYYYYYRCLTASFPGQAG